MASDTRKPAGRTAGPGEVCIVDDEYGSPNTPTSASTQAPRRGGRASRQKGDRRERELVERHRAIGIHSERYPLSGASRFRGSGHDLDLYVFGRDEAPLVAEVKSRKDGACFTTLESWLGEYDCLFLRRDRADALVVLPWRVWQRLIGKVKP
jgi:hypothetical protein